MWLSSCLVVLGLIVWTATVSATDTAAVPVDPLEAAWEALPRGDWGPDRDALNVLDEAIAGAEREAGARAALEERLVAYLGTDASLAAQSYVCRKLKQIGSSRSVPALSSLLDDPDLAHMARFALESIPGEEASAALRKAAARLQGDLQVGVIHSLGRRGDVKAVAVLQPLLENQPSKIAHATLMALAKIDSKEAEAMVLDFCHGQGSTWRAGNACIEIAQRRLEKGRLGEAASVYGALVEDRRRAIRFAAFRGLLAAEPPQAVARILAAVAGDDRRLRRFAAQMVREHPEDSWTEPLAAGSAELPPGGQLLLLDALAPRDHPAVRRFAVAALRGPDSALRAVAVRALANSGALEDVPTLAIAAAADAQLQVAVVETLCRLSKPGVDQALLDALTGAPPGAQVVLIRAIADRRPSGSSHPLLAMAQTDSDAVRCEAFRALEKVADPSVARHLVRLLAKAPQGRERATAERAVWQSCRNIADSEQRVEPLVAELRISPDARAALLPALGRLGGDEALRIVTEAQADPDPQVQDAAVRALSNWPDASVADELIQLARDGAKEEYRIWALRGYARVVAREGRTEPQGTFERLRDAMALATRTQDKQLILSRLTAVRVPDALRLAASYLEQEPLQAEAVRTIVSLGEGMKASHPKEARAALERVRPLLQDPDVALHIDKLLWNMKLKEN